MLSFSFKKIFIKGGGFPWIVVVTRVNNIK